MRDALRRLAAGLADAARCWLCRHPRLLVEPGRVTCGTCPAVWRT